MKLYSPGYSGSGNTSYEYHTMELQPGTTCTELINRDSNAYIIRWGRTVIYSPTDNWSKLAHRRLG